MGRASVAHIRSPANFKGLKSPIFHGKLILSDILCSYFVTKYKRLPISPTCLKCPKMPSHLRGVRDVLEIWIKFENLLYHDVIIYNFPKYNCQAQVKVQVRWGSGKGQEGQIWTWAVPYFWFSPEFLEKFLELKLLSETKPEERQVRSRISEGLGCSLWLHCWDPVLIQHGCL